MIGAVYAKTYEKANEQLQEIAQRYILCGNEIVKQRNTHNELMMVFDNNDTWYAYQHNGSNSCGRRFNIVYIDLTFNRAEQLQIACCATRPPYTGITYFN